MNGGCVGGGSIQKSKAVSSRRTPKIQILKRGGIAGRVPAC
jgi:hypothetical protein